MRIDVKRYILTAALALGTLWDVLCLFGMFQRKWMFSISIVSIGSLCTLIPLLFGSLFPKDEKSKEIVELDTKEKAGAGVMICLAFVWVATAIACFVYPL